MENAGTDSHKLCLEFPFLPLARGTLTLALVQISHKKKGKMFFYFCFDFAALSTHFLLYDLELGCEEKLLKFAPSPLSSKYPQLTGLFFELALLPLALSHDCQSFACSTNSHPKSSINVFISSQHQPPPASQFPVA